MSIGITIDTITTKHTNIIDGAVEEYIINVEALNNAFVIKMQLADYQLKHTISDTATQNWAKCINLTDSYITEMLRNITHQSDDSKRSHIANDLTSDDPTPNLFTKNVNSSYTMYRDIIVEAKKTYNLVIEEYKQRLYNTITHAHNDRETAIATLQKTSITPEYLITFQTIDSEFNMALNLANVRLDLSQPNIF